MRASRYAYLNARISILVDRLIPLERLDLAIDIEAVASTNTTAARLSIER